MTVDEVITKLGRKRIMECLGVGTSQMSNVKSAKMFPATWFGALYDLAQEDGWEMPRDLFAWRTAA